MSFQNLVSAIHINDNCISISPLYKLYLTGFVCSGW